MPDLTFSIPYAHRQGHCPPCNGWSFHHILPVRYYLTAAFILVKLLRLQQCRSKGKTGSPNLKAEFGTADALEFFAECDPKRVDLVEACLSLHYSPGNNTAIAKLAYDSGEDLSTADSIGAIVYELTGPKYGGFAGMAPDQRLDDLGSVVEKRKPGGFSQEHWDQLMGLADVLQTCMPKLAKETNGPFACALSCKSAATLLHHLRILKNDFGRAVYEFHASDWSLISGGKSIEWNFIDDGELPGLGDPHQIARMGVCGKIFKLEAETFGFSIKKTDLLHASNQTVLVVRSNGDRTKVQFAKRA